VLGPNLASVSSTRAVRLRPNRWQVDAFGKGSRLEVGPILYVLIIVLVVLAIVYLVQRIR
jgi:hypothetical protein